MNNDNTVRQQILVHATPASVWHALTNPNQTEKYFFKTRIASSWEVGGPITFTRTILGLFTFNLEGTVREIANERLLAYTLKSHRWFGESDPSEFSTVSISLLPKDGQTLVSISDHVGDYTGAHKRYEKSVKGWDKILRGLKQVSETSAE